MTINQPLSNNHINILVQLYYNTHRTNMSREAEMEATWLGPKP
jgi:hypothetical protein